jgi:hypothetical protein
MFNKLFAFIRHEEQLISELIEFAEKQQTALIKYDIKTLEQIAIHQELIAKNLRNIEEQRIKMISNWLQIQRNDAIKLNLSDIEKFAESDKIDELKKLKKSFNKKIYLLNNLNTTNRVLANKAHNSIGKIISLFTNGTNHLCNVRV